MRKKFFGDLIEYNKNNSNQFHDDCIEFYSSNDISSARTFNRPIEALYEEEEIFFEALKKISNLSIGNKNAYYIPGILEEMDANSLYVCSYKSTQDNHLLRIPFGAFIIKGNNENDNYRIVYNYPKIETLERQIAAHIGLDLNDKNDVKINYELEKDNFHQQ